MGACGSKANEPQTDTTKTPTKNVGQQKSDTQTHSGNKAGISQVTTPHQTGRQQKPVNQTQIQDEAGKTQASTPPQNERQQKSVQKKVATTQVFKEPKIEKTPQPKKSTNVSRRKIDLASSTPSERKVLLEKTSSKVEKNDAKSTMKEAKTNEVDEKVVARPELSQKEKKTKDLTTVTAEAVVVDRKLKLEVYEKVVARPELSHNEKKAKDLTTVTKKAVVVDRKFKLGSINQLKISVMAKFREFDNNNDKLLSRDDFLETWEKHPIDNLDGLKVFQEMDVNSSGSVSLSEFCQWHHTLIAWSNTINYFIKKMKGNDQMISKKDFFGACRFNSLCTETEADQLFKKLDVNGDEMLSLEELSDCAEQKYILRLLRESSNSGVERKVRNRKTVSQATNKVRKPLAKIRKFHLVCRNGVAKLNVTTNATIMSAFNQIDWQLTDRKLSLEEFTTYFKEQGVSKAQSEAMFNNFDKNSDGYITFKEFKNYLNTPQWETKSRRRGKRKERPIK